MASEFFDVTAELGSEEEDEELDEENGETRPRKDRDRAMDDSSEDDEDDEDEEEAARVCLIDSQLLHIARYGFEG